MEHKNDCLICGKELVYHAPQEKLYCFYCHEPVITDVCCKDGHFVCDRCQKASAADLIERYCIRTRNTDPLQMATDLMHSPSFSMHGQEHHFMVPAVLLAAYYNQLIEKGHPEKMAEKEKLIWEARIRASKIPSGYCGYYGTCGAAMGTGIFISLISGATPTSIQEWKLCNTMTAKSLMSIACAGGPRCCKRDSYLAITDAVEFISENLGMVIEIKQEIQCGFSQNNFECLKFGCQFYG
jgi:hypothetical protein